jgi:hypothetical protein
MYLVDPSEDLQRIARPRCTADGINVKDEKRGHAHLNLYLIFFNQHQSSHCPPNYKFFQHTFSKKSYNSFNKYSTKALKIKKYTVVPY